MQTINSNDSLIWQMKYEDMEKKNKKLNNRLDELEGVVVEQNKQIKNYQKIANIDKTRIKELKNNIKYQKERVKNAKNANKTQISLLKDENKTLKDNIKHQEKRIKNVNDAEKQMLKGEHEKIRKEKNRLNKRKKKLDDLELKLATDKPKLLEEIDILKRKNEQLESYCNHLLNRSNPVDWSKNIFKQIGD